MNAPTPGLTAGQVLQAFHHDAFNLFLGAAIVAVGLVAAAFSAIRRKLDLVLIYFYGLVDAVNAKGDFFGQDALSAVLRQTAELAPSAASDRIISVVQQWSTSQDDDLTVLICDYAPSAAQCIGAEGN